MSFKTKKIEGQDLGEYLLACRTRLGLPLEGAAHLARVQPKYLEALEGSRFQDLPAEVYVKGFLRSLAHLYGIGEVNLIQQFETERRLEEHVQFHQEVNSKQTLHSPRFVLSPKVLTFLTVGLLGVVSIGYLYFQVRSLERPPELVIFSPPSDGPVDSSLILVRGETEPGAQVFLNDQALVVDASGNFRENLSLGSGTNLLLIKAVNKFGKETEVRRSIVYAEKSIAGSFTGTTGLVVEIWIGPDPSWVQIEADGVVVSAGTMLPNFQKKVEAQEKIILTTGNAGSTRVIFNGKDLGVLGKEGEVLRNVEFTK